MDVDRLIDELLSTPMTMVTLATLQSQGRVPEYETLKRQVQKVGEWQHDDQHRLSLAAAVFARERTAFLQLLAARARAHDARHKARFVTRTLARSRTHSKRQSWATWVRAVWRARHKDGVQLRAEHRRLRRCLHAWRRLSRRRRAARRLGRRAIRARRADAIGRWKAFVALDRLGDARSKHLCLGTWHRAVLRSKRLREAREARARSAAFRCWSRAAIQARRNGDRQSALLRQRELALLRRAFVELRLVTRRRANFRKLVVRFGRRRLTLMFHRWHVVCFHGKASELVGRGARRRTALDCIRQAFHRWRDSSTARVQKRRTLRRLSALYRRLKTKGAFLAWFGSVALQRAIVGAIARWRRNRHARRPFLVWLRCARRQQHRRLSLQLAIRKCHKSQTAAAFAMWTRHARDAARAATTLGAIARSFRTRLRAAAFVRWRRCGEASRATRTASALLWLASSSWCGRRRARGFARWTQMVRRLRECELRRHHKKELEHKLSVALVRSRKNSEAARRKQKVEADGELRKRIVMFALRTWSKNQRARAFARWRLCTWSRRTSRRWIEAKHRMSARFVSRMRRKTCATAAFAKWRRVFVHRVTLGLVMRWRRRMVTYRRLHVAFRRWRTRVDRRSATLAHYTAVVRCTLMKWTQRMLGRAFYVWKAWRIARDSRVRGAIRLSLRRWRSAHTRAALRTWQERVFRDQRVATKALETMMRSAMRGRRQSLRVALSIWHRASINLGNRYRGVRGTLSRATRRWLLRRLSRAFQTWRHVVALDRARLTRHLATIHSRRLSMSTARYAFYLWGYQSARVAKHVVMILRHLDTNHRRATLASLRRWRTTVESLRRVNECRARARDLLRRLLKRKDLVLKRKGMSRWAQFVVERARLARVGTVARRHVAAIALDKWRRAVRSLRDVETQLVHRASRLSDTQALRARKNSTARDLALLRVECLGANLRDVAKRRCRRLARSTYDAWRHAAASQLARRRGRTRRAKAGAMRTWILWCRDDAANDRVAETHARNRLARQQALVFCRWRRFRLTFAARREMELFEDLAADALAASRVLAAWAAYTTERRRIRALVQKAAVEPGQREIGDYIRDLLTPPSTRHRRGLVKPGRGAYLRLLRRS